MRIISITSGKGGVGKTAISANLGIKLSERGWRTALLDCDFGLANLALNMGLEPKRTLRDVVEGPCSVADALTPGPGGVQVLAGCSGIPALASLDYDKLSELALGFDELEAHFDFLILDNAAGLAPPVLSVSAAADETMLVFTPDPSSMMDAYASAKLLFQMKPGAQVSCVVNNVAAPDEAKVLFTKLHTIVQDFLQERVRYAGCIRRDEAVVRSNRRRQPVTVYDKRSGATRDFVELAGHVSGMPPCEPQKVSFITRLLRRRRELAA
ncbi:MAG: P-loop NTPase [Myxococcales bacterium]|nr:P-loop NTPase [Myxococcales bacterium]